MRLLQDVATEQGKLKRVTKDLKELTARISSEDAKIKDCAERKMHLHDLLNQINSKVCRFPHIKRVLCSC